ncbi:MAG: hypothetical protein KF770_03995 [Anaerolineae bacterium]|nr:hypothetical protein [Anaerolineae bacterium]
MQTYKGFKSILNGVLLLVVLLTIVAVRGGTTVLANNKDLQEDPRNVSASALWANNEEIDAYVNGLKAEVLSQIGEDQQTLLSLEEYREMLKRSLITGEPIANSKMEWTAVTNAETFRDELEAQGINPDTLGIDIEGAFESLSKNPTDNSK